MNSRSVQFGAQEENQNAVFSADVIALKDIDR
jgi:hypothetical protein